jgi:hypothetical protein
MATVSPIVSEITIDEDVTVNVLNELRIQDWLSVADETRFDTRVRVLVAVIGATPQLRKWRQGHSQARKWECGPDKR